MPSSPETKKAMAACAREHHARCSIVNTTFSGKPYHRNHKPKKERHPILGSTRFGLAICAFLGMINLYALRINLSVAIVCMVNNTAIQQAAPVELENDTLLPPEDDSVCYNSIASNSTKKDGEFVWDKELQNIILGSFFWGYVIMQFPGGFLAARFGGKRVMGYALFMASVATLLTPIGSRASPYFLMVLRFICGLGEGVVFPAMITFWSNWAPPLERSILVGFTHAGAPMGNVIAMPVSGILCDYGFAGGWPSIFYVFGSLGILWFISWMLIVTDTPNEHKRISKEERQYINDTVGMAGDEDKKKSLGIPWKAMLTSVPVWMLVASHTCANWGMYVLVTNMPSYMKEVLKFDIKANGGLSAVPYIAFWACINIAANISDNLRAKGVRTGVMRKIVMALGTLPPAAFLIGTGYISCENPYIAVVFLTLAVGFTGFQYSGCHVNQIDIAPPFAGIIFGICNTVASLPGFLAPLAIGKITKHQSQEEWRIVFYISGAIYVVSCVLFTLFTSGEVQEWAKPYMNEVVVEKEDEELSQYEDGEALPLKDGEGPPLKEKNDEKNGGLLNV